jgi:serine/threonine-protein kinase
MWQVPPRETAKTGCVTAAGDIISGRYILDQPIGSGGMATVWRVRDQVTGKDVALKRMHARVQDDPDLIERFRREAQAVSRLSHPAIVRLLDEGQDDDGPYIVFELVEGTNLKALIRDKGPLTPEVAASVASQVARGLEVAHRQGVIHRDIKSHNVLVTDDGTAKLTDFGIARLLDGDQGGLTRTGTVLGTSDYLAPEQARGLQVDGRSDVYSLGIVLYECLTGELPFPADTPMGVAQRQVRDPLPDPRTVNPAVPAYLAAATLRACEKDPSARFATALEMSDALLDAPQGTTGVLPVVMVSAEDEVTGALGITPAPDDDDGATSVRQAVVMPPPTTAPPPPAAPPSDLPPHDAAPGEPVIHTSTKGPSRRLWPGFMAAGLILALVVVGVFIVWGRGSSGSGDRAGNGAPAAVKAPASAATGSGGAPGDAAALQLASVKDVDPSGDNREMPAEVPLAYDGNDQTFWRTEKYATPDFGGVGKTGVGLELALQQPAVATRLDMITKGTGGAFEVLAGPPGASARVVGKGSFTNGKQSVDLTPGAASDVYTLWITEPPPNVDGDGYRAYVGEISLWGTPG